MKKLALFAIFGFLIASCSDITNNNLAETLQSQCNRGNAESCLKLEYEALKIKCDEDDYVACGKLEDVELDIKCNDGDAESCYLMANWDYHFENYAKALKYYKRSCDMEYVASCHKLGVLYSDDENIKKDTTKAKEYFKKNCDLNIDVSCYHLGDLYFLEADFLDYEERLEKLKKAKEYFEKACDLNSADGCYKLSLMYFWGEIVERDYDKEKELREKANRIENERKNQYK